jgi:cysteine desulfurase/selenocysteine lyase
MFNVNKIRKDFPILHRKINEKPIIYFDNACMSLKPIQVIDKINEYYREYPGCGGRSQHKFGNKTTEEFEKSRELIKKLINAKRSDEIIFTRNTTEGINFIGNRFKFNKGDKVLSTDKEHNSNLLIWQDLNKKNIIKHEIVNSNDDNSFNLDEFNNKIKNTKLVSLVHTSNLDGYTIPAKEIIKISHENDALVLLDCAQSLPHKLVDVKKLDVDFIAASGHKILGPTGTGILYGKQELLEDLEPFNVGGETVIDSTYNSYTFEKIPYRFEAGLQDYAGIIGLGEAAKYLMNIDFERHEYELNKKLTEFLEKFKEIKIIGPRDAKLRGAIVNFIHNKINAHDMITILDESSNIMIRSGAHCVHSWFNKHKLQGSARISLYFYNTLEEINTFIESFNKIIKIF